MAPPCVLSSADLSTPFAGDDPCSWRRVWHFSAALLSPPSLPTRKLCCSEGLCKELASDSLQPHLQSIFPKLLLYRSVESKTRPDTRLPKSRAGGQGPYLRSQDHLGKSSKFQE